MGFFQVVAIDFDGTLTSRGDVSAKTLDVIDQVRRNGQMIILVTGRIAEELKAEFPQIADHFDALVLENGAVAVIDGITQALSARSTLRSTTPSPSRGCRTDADRCWWPLTVSTPRPCSK